MLIWKVIGKTNFCNCLREIRKSYYQLPLDTGRFLNVFQTFNLCPLPRGLVQYKLHYSASHSSLQYTRIFSIIKSSLNISNFVVKILEVVVQTLWSQDANWTFIARSEERRSIYLLCPGEKCSKNEENPQKNTSEIFPKIFETLIL